MSFEQYLNDIKDIKNMRKDRDKIIQDFIEEMKAKAGLNNGKEETEGIQEFIRYPLHDSQESKRGLEKTI